MTKIFKLLFSNEAQLVGVSLGAGMGAGNALFGNDKYRQTFPQVAKAAIEGACVGAFMTTPGTWPALATFGVDDRMAEGFEELIKYGRFRRR